MPNTKPDLTFDEYGVCNACNNYTKRSEVNWYRREQELLRLLEKYKNKDGSNYDCIIPVSGGKDSTYQVLKILQYGVKPLCVLHTTCDLTDIGRANIENIKSLGVDLIEFSPNPNIRARLNLIGLRELGDISWPEHVGIFTTPIRAAVQFNVPLIIWGENSQNEYGGPGASVENSVLDRAWLEEFGGLLGFRVQDLIDDFAFDRRDLLNYIYPTDAELARVGVTGIFLGHYLPWDGLGNALVAIANGFTVSDRATLGSMVNYENLDNYQTAIHEYFKYLKFGFGRASDHAALHIRRGRISRRDGIDIVKKYDGAYPNSYLGKSLDAILAPLDMNINEFDKLCDQFTNKSLFKVNNQGEIVKDPTGRPVKHKYDND